MLCLLFAFAGLSLAAPADSTRPLDLYVAPGGNDSWSGTLADPKGQTDGPFATLERARDEIRQRKQAGELPPGPVTVYLRGGMYWRDKTFELTAADSGTTGSPVVYRAYPNEAVRLIGGREIKNWQPVSDPAILERLDQAARGHVLKADLKAAGIADFGKMSRRGFGVAISPAGLELFYRDEPMQLACWPNQGYVKIAAVPAGQHGGKFTYEGDRPNRWAKADDIWVHGYWTWDWAESYEKVKSIDLQKREIATQPPHGVYGYTAGKRWRAINLLEELDTPGEWYLDRKTGKLYFWPPDGRQDAGATMNTACVSVINDMVTMRDVSNVTFQKLSFEVMRGSGIVMTGGLQNVIIGCTFRNIGNLAVTITNATACGVESCDISETGDGGIILSGGDRQTLTPGGLYAINNHIWRFSRTAKTYRPAVSVAGVENRVAHNLIHDAPHMAIALAGNEHAIEYNEIHHVCMETDDVGAFYMGRDYTQRGNIVQYNYFHDLGGLHSSVGSMAVYLDDWTSGTTVLGNICVRAGRAVLVGGGRDNTIENNIFVDCTPAVHIDQRGLGWAKYYFNGQDNTLVDRLSAVPYKEPPWSKKYPELLKLYDDEPARAKGNKVLRNICVGGRWLDLLDGLKEQDITLKDNLVGQDPGFVDAAAGNYRLKPDSPAWKLGFKPIPIDEIGLQSQPLEHPAAPPRR
jgi:hypothetical protein